MVKSLTPLADPDKCKGCLTCALVCSLTKDGSCNPDRARIHISAQPRDITFKECDGCFICTKFCAFGALRKCEL
jgi:Pyruvate/2-oxoacid:ferredoxin oxidoreductase delta subunit